MFELLMKLGLSEKEAKVYLAALELGQDTVQNIAKKARVNRPTAYVILEKLMKSGLVSTVEQGKKTLFVASNPEELHNLLERQDRELHDHKQELGRAMNQLQAIYNAKQDKPRVRYFEGADGLQAMDRYGHDLLGKNKEILTITPIDLLEQSFPERRSKSLGERVKMGIKARTIYTRESGPIPADQNKLELREAIRIDRAEFPLNATIAIYPEWGVKLFYFDQLKPYGVVVEDRGLAQNMKLMFELAWQGAKNLSK